MRSILTALALLVTAGTAQAQQTPATYCASLPATGCEILNVEPVGYFSSNYGAFGYGQIKYCKGNQLRISVGRYYESTDFCSGCSGRDRYSGIIVDFNGARHIFGSKVSSGSVSLNAGDTVTSDPVQFCQRLP